MIMWTLSPTELADLREALADPGVHTLRFAEDEGELKYKTNEDMWTPGIEPTSRPHITLTVAELRTLLRKAHDHGSGLDEIEDCDTFLGQLIPADGGHSVAPWREP